MSRRKHDDASITVAEWGTNMQAQGMYHPPNGNAVAVGMNLWDAILARLAQFHDLGWDKLDDHSTIYLNATPCTKREVAAAALNLKNYLRRIQSVAAPPAFAVGDAQTVSVDVVMTQVVPF